tara:strand:+ start:1389 stop:1682 length:294 start_codon:yes stop_codon:yes gene_type:complete
LNKVKERVGGGVNNPEPQPEKIMDKNEKKNKRIQPSKGQILATATAALSDAVAGLEGANNPHAVKVREELNEVEAKIATMIADRQSQIEQRAAAQAA